MQKIEIIRKELFDVFLCHNSEDKHIVKEIGSRLKEYGLNPWLDEWCLKPGSHVSKELQKQILNIKTTVIFAGKQGFGQWQGMEIEGLIKLLIEKNCAIIPVILPDCEKEPKIPLFLSTLLWVDFRKTTPDPFDQLIWGITGKKANELKKMKQKQGRGRDPVASYKQAIMIKYSRLTMIGCSRSFDMDSIYIPLTVHVDTKSRFDCLHDKTGEKFPARPLKAEDLVKLPYKAAVVLGEPGMGKTTMLHYLALMESKKPDLFPVFVKLADFCRTAESLETFLSAAVANYIPGPAMEDAFQDALQKQKALVLLDGLDEVDRREYNSVAERIQAFIACHPGCRVIITSRKAGFQSHKLPYRVFEIDALPIEEIGVFTGKWFKKETDLLSRITSNQRIHELAQNPFLLSIICFIFEKDRHLPQRRLELYRRCAVALLTLNDKKQVPKANEFTRLLKEQVLEDIAYYFFREEKEEFPYKPVIQQVTQTLAAMEQNHNEEKVLIEICENSGLLRKSDDSYLFVHRSFY